MPQRPEPIAIVGMGCVFPGADGLARFWDNLQQGVDAIGEVPPGRWDPVYYDPTSRAADRFYCRRGGFVDVQATFDPLAFGVMPNAVDGAEPDQLLALRVAKEALDDAGLGEPGAWRQRTGVILGRGGYLTPGLARLDQRVRAAQQLVEVVRAQTGASEEQLQELKTAFQAELGPYGPDTAIGLVPNLAASRIANRLDLQGPAYTVDAACASALLAVDHACRELRSGRCEVVVAGGIHLCQDVTFWSVFTQLGALSRQQTIRPFDRRADGLVIGEGAGVVVLQRLADAERGGRRIYATLLSVGVASDGQGATLMSPRVDGQLLALERAWDEAGADRRAIGFVEAHGTATVQGDEAELTTLRRFFGDGDPVALGSVKSMIGHTMPAAGAAGLIKAALAVHHGVIPPSLHCEEPHRLLERSRFRVPGKTEPWDAPGPRRAAVNAFGFGGINAHALLEQAGQAPGGARPKSSVAPTVSERWLSISAGTLAEVVEALDRGESLHRGGPLRLVLFDPTPQRLALARKVVLRERPWQGHDDLFFSPRGLLTDGGKVAFLFPGLEPTFEPRVADVAERFGWQSALPIPEGTAAVDVERTGLEVVAVSRLLFRAVRALGLRPDAVAGHSVGEWTGMICAEAIVPAAAEAFVGALTPGSLEVPDVLFAMAGCSRERAEAAIEGLADVAVSHDNCPHQVILCGKAASIDRALARLRQQQVLTQKLPFRSGFHSPLFAGYLAPHRRHLAQLPLQRPTTPLWSATTCAPYPEAAEAVRSLAIEHLVRPVRFRELLEAMYGAGFRLFLQIGAGGGLVGFAQDTLKGKPHLAISANLKQRLGLAQLRRLLAATFCEGAEVDLGAVDAPKRSAAVRRLRLDVPMVRPSFRVAANGKLPTPELPSASPVLAAFQRSLQQLTAAQEQVVSAFGDQAQAVPRWIERRRLSLETHPYLRDHAFYRQPRGWSVDADIFPLVPMTLSVDWLFEAASRLAGRTVSVLENVRALRWVAVAPPIEATLHAERQSASRAHVSLEGYAMGDAALDARPEWSEPPPLAAPTPVPLPIDKLYPDRWLFHGPAYQGVTQLTAWSDEGIDGELTVPTAPGALLDNAGQLLGLWVMLRTDVDRLALPMLLARVDLHGAAPLPGERLRCAVRIRSFDAQGVKADLWVTRQDGRPYCRILGWEDRRFESDARLWEVLRWPEKSLLAVSRPGGYLRVTDAWRTLPSRELLARRYLGAKERAQWEALPSNQQGPWLNGRIAAKDAVRELLWKQGVGELFPIEVEVVDDAEGRHRVRGSFAAELHVALSQIPGAAVARVSARSPVGIALARPGQPEVVAADRALSPAERTVLGAWAASHPAARIWTAKEAVAKMRGPVAVDPARLPLQEVAGDRLRIDGQWVASTWDEPFIVAWSET